MSAGITCAVTAGGAGTRIEIAEFVLNVAGIGRNGSGAYISRSIVRQRDLTRSPVLRIASVVDRRVGIRRGLLSFLPVGMRVLGASRRRLRVDLSNICVRAASWVVGAVIELTGAGFFAGMLVVCHVQLLRRFGFDVGRRRGNRVVVVSSWTIRISALRS